MAIISIKQLFRDWLKPYLTVTKSDISDEVSVINANIDSFQPFIATVGNGVAKEFILNHGFNTRDVHITVYRSSSPYSQSLTDNERFSVNEVKIIFFQVPALNEFRVIISKI
jgi:hypothetical protein